MPRPELEHPACPSSKSLRRLSLSLCRRGWGGSWFATGPQGPTWSYYVRLCFFHLLAIAILLSQPRSAGADSVEARLDYIVGGRPVPSGDTWGTVALLAGQAEEDAEDFSPITYSRRLRCSGTLITPTAVLTAGHCVAACEDGRCETVPAGSVFVGVGLTSLDSVWEAEIATVSSVVLHPDYTDWDDLRFDAHEDCGPTHEDPNPVCTRVGFAEHSNDVAILNLKHPVTSRAAIPILPPERVTELAGTTDGIAQGYGRTRRPDSSEILDQDLYQSLLNQGVNPIVLTSSKELATAAGDDRSGVCYGDSGGPLYVEEDGGVVLVGVASRLRWGAREECGGGGVYALAPAHLNWIYDNAKGQVPATLSGGGGCSTSRGGPSRPIFSSLALLLLLGFRARKLGPTLPVLLLLLSTSVACGSAGDVSLCTERYDPLGVACDPAVERLDLQTAEALARDEVPESAWLWQVRSSYQHVDPDGNAESWELIYFVPGEAEPPEGRAVSVRVSPSGVQELSSPYPIEMVCLPTRPIEAFDSRATIHDSIRRLERDGVMVLLREPGDLGLVQNHRCSNASLRLNGTWYTERADSDRVSAVHSAGYTEAGEFTELRHEIYDP